MRTILHTTLCLCLLLISTARGQNSDFLDLTRAKVTKEKLEPGKIYSGGGVLSTLNHSVKKDIVPLKIELLNLNKFEYRLGEQVIYEVRLENITDDTVVIPCLLDQDQVKPDEQVEPTGYLVASIYLVVKDEVWGDQFVASQVLYGSALAPDSLKYLFPGQKIVIRLSGRWGFTNDSVSLRLWKKTKESPQVLEARAGFSFSERFNFVGPAQYYLPSVSKNGIPFKLRSPQE